jgi:hypothetical protein
MLVYLHLKVHSNVWFESLKKTMRNLSQSSRSPGRIRSRSVLCMIMNAAVTITMPAFIPHISSSVMIRLQGWAA